MLWPLSTHCGSSNSPGPLPQPANSSTSKSEDPDWPILSWATLDPITVSRFPSVVWLAGVKFFSLRESGDSSTGAHHRRGVEVPCADKVWDEISRVIPNPGRCHITATSPREESAQDLRRLGVNLVSLQKPFHFYHRVSPRPPAAHPPSPCSVLLRPSASISSTKATSALRVRKAFPHVSPPSSPDGYSAQSRPLSPGPHPPSSASLAFPPQSLGGLLS